jgi:6-phosphogluconolactonase
MTEQPLDRYGSVATAPARRATRVLVGGYAGPETPAHGIVSASIDPATGELSVDGVFTDVPNPFHLVLSPSGQTLYVASNVEDGRVVVLRVAADGALTPIGEQSAAGAGTVHLGLHGQHLYAVNHDSGTVVVFPVRPDETLGPVADVVQHVGSGPHPAAQAGPHPHMAVIDPAGTRLLVPDKGTDCVYVYRVDAETGLLTPASQVHLGAGVGPRHLVFHPSGRYVYVVSELVSTVTVCGYEPATGALWTIGSAPTVPPGTQVWNAPSGIAISPDGRFVYAANRGHESIAVLAVSDGGSALRQVGCPQVGSPVTTLPWDLAVDPGGTLLYVANQLAGTVAAFVIDAASGLLTPTGTPIAVPTAACLLLR